MSVGLKEKENFIRKMVKFKVAAGELLDAWDKFDTPFPEDDYAFYAPAEAYPFDKSFDDVYFSICYWIDVTAKKLGIEEVMRL